MYTSVQLFNQESRWPSFIGLGVILLLSIFYMDKKITPMPMVFLLLFCIWGNVLGFTYGMTGPLVIASIVEFFTLLGANLVLAGSNNSSERYSEYYAEMYDGPTEEKKN
ncbi:MAG: hypothetical protein IKR60_02125, partial [Alphaproteobacteria bacterium]|nr:hypothetical protein [Alphaproteobacteria bacterium]